MHSLTEFRKELQKLLNRYSMENKSNTPDFVLARYLTNCLIAFNQATLSRDEFHQSGWRPERNSLWLQEASSAQPSAPDHPVETRPEP